MRYGSLPSATDVLSEGDVVAEGRYEILGVLGRGGMATVYSARRIADGVEVALKVVKDKLARRADIEYRMRNELEFAAELAGHPNIVQPLEAGRLAELDDAPYLVTERAVGRPLSRIIAADRVLGAARACRIALDIAQALRALHERKIIHRDVKPENIIVGTDEHGIELAKLIDFGLVARVREDGAPSRMTAIDERPGTKLYMAPEQAAGAPPASSFDVYALGVTMHEMLAGTAPLTGLPQDEMLAAKLATNEPELSIARMRIALPDGVAEVVDACLVRDSRARLTIADVCERLAELTVSVTPSSPDAVVAANVAAAPAIGARRSAWVPWALVAAVVGGVGGYAWISRVGETTEPGVGSEPRVPEAAAPGDTAVADPPTVAVPNPSVAPAAAVTPSVVTPPVEVEAPVEPPPVEPPPGEEKAIRKPQPPRPAAPHTTAECEQRRSDVDAAVASRRWQQVLELTASAACWSGGAARRVARIQALVALERYADCAKSGERGSLPADVADMVEYCRSKMEAP